MLILEGEKHRVKKPEGGQTTAFSVLPGIAKKAYLTSTKAWFLT